MHFLKSCYCHNQMHLEGETHARVSSKLLLKSNFQLRAASNYYLRALFKPASPEALNPIISQLPRAPTKDHKPTQSLSSGGQEPPTKWLVVQTPTHTAEA